MEAPRFPVTLRVQLTDAALRQLKARASIRGHALDLYADMIFHYSIHERSTTRWNEENLQATNFVYLLVEIPLATKLKLSDWSQRQQVPLAAFTGLLIDAFLRDFEKDPRDFSMIHYVSSQLD